ncbi:MAG: hypothetical protein ACLRSE_02225 [Alistipes finegoldii]
MSILVCPNSPSPGESMTRGSLQSVKSSEVASMIRWPHSSSPSGPFEKTA